MILNKNGGEMVQTGSLEFMFSRKTVIQFPITEGMNMDEIELDLIDHGLEEMGGDLKKEYQALDMVIN